MKKIIYTLGSVAVTAALLLVGCGSNTTNNTNSQGEQTTQSASTDDGSTKKDNFQKADLEGEVTSVNGSKITLKVIKTPEKNDQNGDQKNNQNGPGSNGQKPDSDGNDKDKQSSEPPKMQVEYTGESKDITIGDGITIKAMNRGKQGSEAKDLNVSDIKVGDILQITYSDKDNQTISNINVRQATKQNGQTSNN
ncbi:hypothetical protein [Clostridium saccharobutylicum]|uniref:DUF5666 domain-containing protein n=1 Tax=Clostridium saccharobutylicum TaxID=169679 RepID=A0A1S8NJS7_CLOSA|nr:hypothetical protein [Clostridium saccharobutylicum]OOM16735.1 hypothetical protein CLOSAC_10290 [Clostridium saccharobutylicum]